MVKIFLVHTICCFTPSDLLLLNLWFCILSWICETYLLYIYWCLSLYTLNVHKYIISGELVSVLQNHNGPLPCNQVLQIMYQSCRAVQHMHKQKPAIIHRDLKVRQFVFNVTNNSPFC